MLSLMLLIILHLNVVAISGPHCDLHTNHISTLQDIISRIVLSYGTGNVTMQATDEC